MTRSKQPHPLLDRKIVGIGSWAEWLKRWEKVATAEEMISLLHYGFDTATATSHDSYARVLFYLRVADGHDDWHGTYIGCRADDTKRRYVSGGIQTSLRRVSPPHDLDYTSVELRRVIAKKAWEVLCVKFFREWMLNDGSIDLLGWFRYRGSKEQELELLKALFEFLDPKHGVNNLSVEVKHHREHFEEFMQRFIKRAWEVVAYRIYPDYAKDMGEIISVCAESRPRLMNMMSALGWEKMLLKLSFDERMITHLEAQITEWSRQRLSVCTLEEHALQGHEPAQVLLLLRIRAKKERGYTKKVT